MNIKQPPALEALNRGSKEAIIIYILSENDSDCETMEANDRATLIAYCAYMQQQQDFEENYMLFEHWVNSSPDDIKNYSK